MKIAIGSDHAGYEYKRQLIEHLVSLGHEIEDFGCNSIQSVDYPDFGQAVGEAVAAGKALRGIVVCYSGVGISIAANKVKGVRCAHCQDVYTAQLCRQHNDTNVLAFGAGMIGLPLAKQMIGIWLETPFEGGRHQMRVDKIAGIETRS